MFWIPKSCASNILRYQSRKRKLFYYQRFGFIKSIEKDYKYFFTNVAGLQEELFNIQ